MSIPTTTTAATASRRATYQDVLDAPPHRVAEIIDGMLHTHPRPSARHAWASTGLGEIIGPPFNRGRGGPGGWWIVDEPELHLGEDILVPDLSGWRRTRMPEYPDTAYFTLAPDWVCEVLFDQGEKRGVYAREGVGHLWFVDPDVRTLEAFELRDGHWVLLDTLTGGASVSLPPFDAIRFSLGDLWPDAGPQTGDEGAGDR
ncbi:MAG: Uma2 family endonuclease [Deltaproteobacteria bacterium]|nr:Uma2 family endonuclease [Deltaproteobacteria bacterium]